MFAILTTCRQYIALVGRRQSNDPQQFDTPEEDSFSLASSVSQYFQRYSTFFNLFNMVKSFFTKGSLLAGYLEFYFAKQRGGLDPLSLNDQEKGTPPLPPLKGNSRHMLCLVSRHHHHHHDHQHHHHHHHHHHPPHHHHHSTWKSDFSTSIFQVPNGAMKVTGSSIHRYRKKRHWSLCWHWSCFVFPARCVCLTMYTSKWLFKWTKWWATMDIVGCSLFGSRYLRSALNVQFHAPPSELSSHALCVSSRSSPFAVSHHQHHRHHHPHHHHHSAWNSDFSTSIFQVPNGAMKVTGSSIHRYRKKRHWSLC